MRFGYLGTLEGIKKMPQSTTAQNSKCKSFSLSYDNDDLKLYSHAKITIGSRTIFTDKAMWDTGATITAISHKTANRFDVLPDDSGTSISASGVSDADIYIATIELPGGIVFENIEVWDVDLSDHGAEIIIGMNIISQGRLVVENINGVPMFSFSIEK